MRQVDVTLFALLGGGGSQPGVEHSVPRVSRRWQPEAIPRVAVGCVLSEVGTAGLCLLRVLSIMESPVFLTNP